MIHDDMIVDQLILHREMPKIFYVTQQWYNDLSSKDPHCIYIISNSQDKRVYYGEVLIVKDNDIPRYYIASGNVYGEYSLYINYKENYTDRLVKIADYDSLEKVVNDFNAFNKVGYHSTIAVKFYNIICSYLRRGIS